MSTRVVGMGGEFSVCSVGGRWEWRVVADSSCGVGQAYSVQDIRTPFGSIASADIPIPGDVIAAMAESLVQLQQQLRPMVQLVGSPSLSVTATEGGATADAGTVTFVNAGAFGSVMTVTAAPSAPWLSVVPSTVPGLGKNQQGSVTVRVDPSLLLSSGSPYSAYVTLQDDAGNQVTVPVNVTVLPRPSIAVSNPALTLTFWLTSMVSGGSLTSTITNVGPAGSTLAFSLAKILNVSPWLAYSPASASGLASGSSSDVTFSVVADKAPAIPGTYVEKIQVKSPTADNSPREIEVTLVVSP